MTEIVRKEPNAATVHPSIAKETALLDRSIELAEQAAQAITIGAMPAKDCNILLSAGRMLQGASRQNIVNRLSAGRLAMQEAKLIEGERPSAA